VRMEEVVEWEDDEWQCTQVREGLVEQEGGRRGDGGNEEGGREKAWGMGGMAAAV